jgi:hypothetical protein
MTPERFAALAEAYGGDLDRWPADAQAAARLRLASDPGAHAVLAEAAGLDALLSADVVAPPSAELQRRILTAAAQPRPPTGLLGRWMSVLGAAGAMAAGAAMGAVLVLSIGPSHKEPDPAGGFYEQSSFGDVAQLDEPPSAAPRT